MAPELRKKEKYLICYANMIRACAMLSSRWWSAQCKTLTWDVRYVRELHQTELLLAVGFIPVPPAQSKFPARADGLPAVLRFITLNASSSSSSVQLLLEVRLHTRAADMFHARNNAIYICWILSRVSTSFYQPFWKELIPVHVFFPPFSPTISSPVVYSYTFPCITDHYGTICRWSPL